LQENSIVLLGAGNLATQLGIALQDKGFSIAQVYSRTLLSAETLGNRLHTDYTDKIENIIPDATIYLFSLKDSALPEVLTKLPSLRGLFIHTAGSIPSDVFAGHSERYGVLYPLQTFSKNRKISFDDIPLFVEANHPEDEALLEDIARTLSNRVVRLSSEKRVQLHLAAVFAGNFTNHLYYLASQILEEQSLDRQLLLPLIREIASKIEYLHPREAQTGPAVRYDENVMNKHLEMLKDKPHWQELYRLLSRNIYRQKQKT
jgi:predicted short-subunit dehydrogenase-like oxidoreductase (DUF2520 family)